MKQSLNGASVVATLELRQYDGHCGFMFDW